MSHLSLDLTSLLHCNQHGPSDRCIPATRADHLHLPGPPLATSVSDCFFKKHFGEVWGIAPFRLLTLLAYSVTFFPGLGNAYGHSGLG